MLRGLSAILIVVHHAGASAYLGRSDGRLQRVVEVMDIGVAVFFVTSGFLIYRPLASANLLGGTRQGLVDFWWRRLLRVVPAYWVAVTAFWGLGTLDLGDRWWRVYTFTYIYDVNLVGKGLAQGWTLATEVAFYLLVPLWAVAAGALVRRVQDLRHRVGIELLLCAGLWALAVISRWGVAGWWPHQRGASFLWLPMNLDTFAWGMALAVVSVWCGQDDRLKARLAAATRRVAAWWAAAAALFVWYGLAIGPAPFIPGYVGWFWQRRQLTYLAIALLLVIPVVFGEEGRGWLRRVWSWPAVVWTGTVSYGLYLWHFDWIKEAMPGQPFSLEDRSGWFSGATGDRAFLAYLAVGLGLGLLCAALSWYLIERPAQRFKGLAARRGGRAMGRVVRR